MLGRARWTELSASSGGEREEGKGEGELGCWRWTGPGRVVLGRGKEGESGPGWARVGKGEALGQAGFQAGLGFLWVAMGLGLSFVLGFLSISPFLFLIQTITQLGEFKFNFEFTTSTQTNKLMHQHECNN